MKLAVLGSPIAHSKSPALHAAAYGVLGLDDWHYDAIDIDPDALPGFVADRGEGWRGLSLTMPLKKHILPLLTTVDPFTELTGAANTVLFDGADRRGFNTDVIGIVDSFRAAGVAGVDTAVILGGGATAASALVALSQLGATAVTIAVRSPDRIGQLVALAEQLEITLAVTALDDLGSAVNADAVVSTLPNDTDFSLEPITDAVLFDVAYEPWPSVLASAWLSAGNTVVPGIEMLVRQALAQVRIFVGATPDAELPDEAAVFAAMRASVGLGA